MALQTMRQSEQPPGSSQISDAERQILGATIDLKTWKAGEFYFFRDDGKPYVPSPNHQAFIESTARFPALFGGRGSGKTAAGAQRALQRIRQGLSGAVLNPDFENLKFSTWPELRRWIPWHRVLKADRRMGLPGWEPSQAFVIHFENPASTVWVKGVKDPDSARGPNINWLWYDEGGRDRPGLSWKTAIAGVRIGPNPSAWTTTTPRGKGHWLYSTFVRQEVSEEIRKLLEGFSGALYDHWFVSIEDNKDNLDPAFYLSLKATYGDSVLAQQELEGKFVSLQGLVYPGFSEEIHLLDPFEIESPLHWRGMDYGYTNPGSCEWMAIDYDQNIYVYDEVYAAEKGVGWWKEIVHAKTGDDRIEFTQGCPRFFQKEQSRDGHTVAEEYEKQPHQIILEPSNVSFDARFQRLTRLLTPDPKHRHPITGELGAPYFYVFRDRAPGLVAEFESREWRDVKGDGADTSLLKEAAEEGNDHALEPVERLVWDIWENRRKPEKLRWQIRKEKEADDPITQALRVGKEWADKFRG